jgi:hypothetical protein
VLRAAGRLNQPTAARYFAVSEMGKLLVIVGVIIVTVGALLWSGIGTGPLGRLPGDIRIERGGSGFYFPIVTCIIVSIVLSLIMWFFRR